MHPGGATLAGYSVTITEVKTRWESGKITLGERGTFQTELHAEQGRKCEYEIALFDPKGSKVPSSPERISYTIGLSIAGEPMSHHLGVATAKNTMKMLLEKGTVLPTKSKAIKVRTTQSVKKGDGTTFIRIPVVEGENETRADRNRMCGSFILRGDDRRVTRDIPVGTEITIQVEIDESKKIQSTIFIELLELEFEEAWDLKKSSVKPEVLKVELKSEKERLEELKEQAAAANDSKAKEVIQEIEEQDLVHQAQTTIASAQGDADARGEADRKVLNLRTKVDQLEDLLAWPKLVQEAEAQLATTRELVEDKGSRSHRTLFQELQGRLLDAISQKNVRTLRAIVQQLDDLHTNVLLEQPTFWAGYLGWLKEREGQMREPDIAAKLFRQGERAIQEQDLESLQGAVRQLQRLLPSDQQDGVSAAGFGASIE
jgi:molecular chaperone DnaK